MKKNLLLPVLMFVLAAMTAYGQVKNTSDLTQSNGVFNSKTGRFSFIPPKGFGDFTLDKSPASKDADSVEINRYEQDLDRGTCIVAFYDLPESVFQAKTIQKMLEDGRDGSLKNGASILDKETAITIDGYQGLSIYGHLKSGENTIYFRSDLVIAKPRSYNYMFLSTDESELYKADVKAFFSSFHITK